VAYVYDPYSRMYLWDRKVTSVADPRRCLGVDTAAGSCPGDSFDHWDARLGRDGVLAPHLHCGYAIRFFGRAHPTLYLVGHGRTKYSLYRYKYDKSMGRYEWWSVRDASDQGEPPPHPEKPDAFDHYDVDLGCEGVRMRYQLSRPALHLWLKSITRGERASLGRLMAGLEGLRLS
jgi:hypothetical protein